MKIAQIAPLIERVPPKRYGGTERIVHSLTEELVRRGHEVTLFASGDSLTSAALIAVYPRSLREAKIPDAYGLNVWTVLHLGLAYQWQDRFDIIHDHTVHAGVGMANLVRSPVLMTMHNHFTFENRQLFKTLRRPYLITISQAQERFATDLNHIGTVYHGIDAASFPFSESDDGYLLTVGRISMEKGTHHAIAVARNLNLPLVIAAKLDPQNRPYFRAYVEPYLTDDIVWIGEVDERQRNRLMSRARCLLHPVTWPEPFGLTMIEAMACGCPVIAFQRGSTTELVEHERTGFTVGSVDEMTEAVMMVADIDRQACRRHVLGQFTVSRMVDGYELMYNRALGRA